jgi:hypothetical protein
MALGSPAPRVSTPLRRRHPAVVVVHPGRSIAATLKRYEWECPDSGATVAPTRVLRVLSEAEWENTSQEAFDLLVSTGATS